MENEPKDRDTIMDSALLRLLHLVSPTLPTGAFSYSQGLEWAIENDWINDQEGLGAWLLDLMEHSMAYVDIPLLKGMYQAIETDAPADLERCCDILLACRESLELQEEEQTRGRAMATLIGNLGLLDNTLPILTLKRCQLAGYVLMAHEWHITVRDAALGYVWAWLENQVLTGIKIVPLGQTQGQQLLMGLSTKIPDIVTQGLALPKEEIGATSTGLALACANHETQYTRLYRS